MSSKKFSSTKVNVNYVESSIDIFKFYQRVLNVGATIVTISWLHYQIYPILVALTQFLQVNETVLSITKF